jgi:peptidoglycan hydrolase-like protein with peptidoglycan-binding domain
VGQPQQQPAQPAATPAPTPAPAAPAPPPMSAEQAAFVNLPQQQMSQIQTILQQQNFYHGTVDGAYGGQTSAAVQAWQRANGYTMTGYMDGPQLGALLKASKSQTASATPAAAPAGGETVAAGTSSTASSAPPSAAKIDPDTVMYEIAKDGKTVGPQDSIIWHGGEDAKYIKPAYQSAITPQTMRVRAGKEGAEVVWVYEEGDFSMPFSSEKCGGATVDKICMVQVALHDFDGDGRPEIVITVSDGATNLKFWVLQYYRPSAEPTYRAKRDYWSVILEGDGQREIDLQNGRITVPVGTKGGADEYNYTGRKFVKRS